MEKIKKGDIVARKSHNLDILFSVEKIIRSTNGIKIAILKGITTRIVADSYLNDLVVLNSKEVDDSLRSIDIKIEDRINRLIEKGKEKLQYKERNFQNIKTGKILHLDGDKKYSQKSMLYYKKIGLDAIVKNISENQQPKMIYKLLQIYKPDILVITRS